MLSSRYRFHGHGSLRFVYSRGTVARSRYFICKSVGNARRQQPRIAVVVSKKVIKSAVKRNRIRRRLYEAIRLEMDKLEPRSDIVIIAVSAEILTASPADISSVLSSCLAQSGLYKQPKS
jgi:ribonuclease P protein component